MKNDLILMNHREIRYGWRYLLFNLVFMGPLLALILTAIYQGISSAIFNVIYFACNFLVVAVLFRKFWVKSLRDVKNRIGTCLLTALGCFLLIRILDILVGMLILRLDPGFYNVNDQGIAQMAQQYYGLIVLGSCVLVPIAEEALYRGLVFGSLFRRSPVLAYGISVGIFAFIHISEYVGYYPTKTLLLCFLQYIPAGLGLALSYHLSGSLLTSILIHATVNTIGMLAMR